MLYNACCCQNYCHFFIVIKFVFLSLFDDRIQVFEINFVLFIFFFISFAIFIIITNKWFQPVMIIPKVFLCVFCPLDTNNNFSFVFLSWKMEFFVFFSTFNMCIFCKRKKKTDMLWKETKKKISINFGWLVRFAST